MSHAVQAKGPAEAGCPKASRFASRRISASFCGLNTGSDHGPAANRLDRSPYRGHAICNDRGPSRAHPIGDSGQDPRTPSSFGMQMESFATIRLPRKLDQRLATGPRNTLNWFLR